MRTVTASSVYLPPGTSGLLDALCARFPHVDRARWRSRLQAEQVFDAAGVPLAPDADCSAGRRVRYFREVEHESVLPVTATVLYRDAHIVVADKPPFLPVQPAGRFVTDTLLGRLQRELDCPDLAPVHRIDRVTRGLVLLSCNPETRGAYAALWRERRVHKRYAALAAPLPERAFPWCHASRIERGDPFFRMREVAGTPNSETRIEVLDRGARLWRYALYPLTGRKHQLRVHMAALGAPILHDRWYPDLQPEAPDELTRPLALVAAQLAFIDPVSGEHRRFCSRQHLDGSVSPATGACF